MDDAARELKGALMEHLEEDSYEVQDDGIREGADYPDVTVEAVAVVEHAQAILCCGTELA